MGMLDDQHKFSAAQAITDDAASTNYIDLGVARDIAPGERMAVEIHIDETFATNTSVDFAIQTDPASDFSTGPTTLATMNKTVSAALNAGDVYEMVVPSPTSRYLRMFYTVNGTNASAGKITAYLNFATAQQSNMV